MARSRDSLRVFADDVLAHAQQLGEIAGQRVGLGAHLRHHGAERDRGAHRLQRILRPHHQRRRRLAADALQRGEDFDDHGAALVERFLKVLFPLVERLQARLRRLDVGLDVADARRGIDELLIERAAVVAEGLDLELELGLASADCALLGARRVELLVVLLERVGIGLWPACPGQGRPW